MSKRGSGSSTRASGGFVDHSRYAKQHQDVVSFVKKQVGVDLNKYRDGDGSSPSTSSYWEKDGAKVAFDLKGMSSSDRTKLMQLAQKPFGVILLAVGLDSFRERRKSKAWRDEP